MKTMSNMTEKRPRPNLVGSPKIDCQSSESNKFIESKSNFLNEESLTVVVRIQHHLKHGESSTGEIEKNVADAPSHGAFPPVIHHNLRHVLDECDGQLDVAACIEEIQPMPDAKDRYAKCDNDDCEEDADDASCNVRDTLISALCRDGNKSELKFNRV
jgi:hypothetical protein